jgi:hypothetical protein
MFTSERIRIRPALSFDDEVERLRCRPREIHREPGRTQIAAELLAKQSLYVGLVDDESGFNGPL